MGEFLGEERTCDPPLQMMLAKRKIQYGMFLIQKIFQCNKSILVVFEDSA